MIACPKCGIENDDCLGQTVCFRCGAELPGEPSEQQPFLLSDKAMQAPLGWRLLRTIAILIYSVTMCGLVTSVATLFFPHTFPALGALMGAVIWGVLASGTLLLLKRAAQKTAPPDFQPRAAYNRCLVLFPFSGIASWATYFSRDLGWLSGWAMIVTLVGGLYILFKVWTFLWRYFLVVGIAIGLAWAPTQVAAMAGAKKKAGRIQTDNATTRDNRCESYYKRITGANSRCAGQLDGSWSYNVAAAGARALPGAVAQFYR